MRQRFISVLILVSFFLAAGWLCAADTTIPGPPLAVGLGRPDVVPLDGTWHFKEDPKNEGEAQSWQKPGSVRGREVLVPLPWQLAVPELSNYIGAVWYERAIQIPAGWAGRRVALGTYGIANEVKIHVNGQFVEEARDIQQDARVFDLTRWIKPGAENTITLKVTDGPGGMLGSWTVNRASGLWKELWLEATGQTFISDLHMLPDVDRKQVTAEATVMGVTTEPLEISLKLKSPSGEEIQRAVAMPQAANTSITSIKMVIDVPNAALWDLEHPNLYHVEAELRSPADGGSLDRASTDFGFRKLEARGERIYLNDAPIYLLGGGLDPGPYGGPLDVNYHLPPPYKPKTDADYRRAVEEIKSLGVNFVRITLRPAPPRFLYWADRLGLFIWEEWPWFRQDFYTKEGKLNYEWFKVKWAAQARRDRNHPSIFMYGLFNEGLPGGQGPVIVSDVFKMLKTLDPRALVQDSAGGQVLSMLNYPESHVATDIDDVHWYPSFFEEDRLNFLVTGTRAWSRPVLLSEFGPIPYVSNFDKAREKWGGELPWWATSQAASYAIYGTPGAMQDRFNRWGLNQVWPTLAAMAQASDFYYGQGFRKQISLIRTNPQIAGVLPWVYESAPHPTGWIDYFGDKKVFADDLAKIMRQDALSLQVYGRSNLWETEKVRITAQVAHFGTAAPIAGTIRWKLEGTDLSGTISHVKMEAGNVGPAGTLDFIVPKVEKPGPRRLSAQLESGGKVVAENYIELNLFPLEFRKPYGHHGAIYQIFGQRFSMFGIGAPTVWVATKVDDFVTSKLEQGETVLLMACAEYVPGFPDLVYREIEPSVTPFLKKHGLDLASREQGAHSDTFFIRPTKGLFERIPHRNPLDWPFLTVWPRHTIQGIKSEYKDDVLAGAFGMMLGSRAYNSDAVSTQGEVNGTLVQCRYGKGRLIICTFDLLLPYADDPVATIMMHDLLVYASGNFDPKLRLK